MAWNNPLRYSFRRFSILENAPPESGIYAIYGDTAWIYIGEANDIQAKLIRHLSGDYPCIFKGHPSSFSYEICPANRRFLRRSELIRELKPLCNIRLY